MDPEQQRKISVKGGQRAHELGVAHVWDKAAAVAAGRKGGLASGKKRRAHIDIEGTLEELAAAGLVKRVDGT